MCIQGGIGYTLPPLNHAEVSQGGDEGRLYFTHYTCVWNAHELNGY